MRFSKEYYSSLVEFERQSAQNSTEHLTTALLLKLIRTRASLNEAQLQHVDECRDCRDFVAEFSLEARASGASFPDLLPAARKMAATGN